MKEALKGIGMVLFAMLFMFGFECLTNGVDLTIERSGDTVCLSTTNNTFSCVQFQWSRDLQSNNWYPYRTLVAPHGDVFATNILFRVPVDNERTFWRIKDCAEP